MAKIKRNAPCPCGSGKKYKFCCLRAAAEARAAGSQSVHARDTPGADAIDLAAVWLYQHHDESMTRAFHTIVFAGLKEKHVTAIRNLPESMKQLVHHNGHEYLLAEGIMEIDGEYMCCADVVLGPGGPDLSPQQRDFLEAIRYRPMSFYQVVEAQPGVGFRVHDMVDEDEPDPWIAAPVVSQGLVAAQGSIFAGRLLPGDPWRVSTALYPNQQPHVSGLLDQIREERETQPDPLQPYRVCGMLAVFSWLFMLTRISPAEIAMANAGLGQPS